MSHDQIIALLTEIRDLQKRNVENYKLVLQKQQEAIDLQRKYVADFQQKFAVRQRLIIITVIAITLVAFFIVAITPSFFPRVNH